ncbi:hypothetical protein [Leptospira meyeri]|uniref:hypothetical protein n=1 Tax=Leptospira meyeri TaxID=29508 RepID=UPI00223C8D6A|nr:hypothetical protein [Leptospira meyeri]MCW7490900.1 hypothetical protein [Leptospira meyeri]
MEIYIFENESLVYFKLNENNAPVVRSYPYIEILKRNPSTSYKWSLSNLEELRKFVNSIRKEKNSFINNFVRPKVLVLFPEDIFESERVFLRILFEGFAREIYLIEFFHICQLSIFSISNLVGKKILSLGERLNQTFTQVENSNIIDTEIFDITNMKIQEMEIDLVISNNSEIKYELKSDFFLHGEELRKHLILGSKIYIEYINSISR